MISRIIHEEEVIFTVPELSLLRENILSLLSHKNKKGNTIIIEAILEDRVVMLNNLRVTNLVRQDLEKERTIDLNIFFRKYEDITNKVASKRRKRRRCIFWETEEDDDPEESMGLIQK